MTGHAPMAPGSRACPRCGARMVEEDRYAAGFTLHCLHCGERRLYQRRAAVVAQERGRQIARADAMGWSASIRRGRPRKEEV